MHTLNLGILAHVDAGKTTLTERLLFSAGAIGQIGSVDAGTTQTDSLELERERGITIRSAVASFAIGDLAVNLVDTPGHPDFIAEVERVLARIETREKFPTAPLMTVEDGVVRREFVRRFPYLVIFVETETVRKVIMIRSR